MLLIAALLSAIVWVLGWNSGFLGPLIHVFLLLALLAVLAHWWRQLPPAGRERGTAAVQNAGPSTPEQPAQPEHRDGAKTPASGEGVERGA